MESNGSLWVGTGIPLNHWVQSFGVSQEIMVICFLPTTASGNRDPSCGLHCFQNPNSGHVVSIRCLANALAQAEALLLGREAPQGEPHGMFPGNRPSTFMLFDSLTPKSLGTLIALHEHRIFIQKVLRVSQLDQWGVELEKPWPMLCFRA